MFINPQPSTLLLFLHFYPFHLVSDTFDCSRFLNRIFRIGLSEILLSEYDILNTIVCPYHPEKQGRLLIIPKDTLAVRIIAAERHDAGMNLSA